MFFKDKTRLRKAAAIVAVFYSVSGVIVLFWAIYQAQNQTFEAYLSGLAFLAIWAVFYAITVVLIVPAAINVNFKDKCVSIERDRDATTRGVDTWMGG
jgi:hypothetical protein